MAALEDVFGTPVIEAYGMTEAAHETTSEPLPPAPRKPGSVGLAAGPESPSSTRRGTYSSWRYRRGGHPWAECDGWVRKQSDGEPEGLH